MSDIFDTFYSKFLEKGDYVYSTVFASLLFCTSEISLLMFFACNYIELLLGQQWCHCDALCGVPRLGPTEAKRTQEY